MNWVNSSLVTSDLFLELELLMYNRTIPSLQTILNLNEIVELVVLREKLLMPSSDHIVILKTLNEQEIKKLGGNKAVNWSHELKNLGKGHLLKPIITCFLIEKGILVLDTEQKDDIKFREFGDVLFTQQWSGRWILKTTGFNIKNPKEKYTIEKMYIKSFNNTFKFVSSDSLYWKMAILAAPDLAPDIKRKFGYDYSWTYHYYKEVEIYSKFAKRTRIGFNDNVFMQPFIVLNFSPSKNFIDIFYNNLKHVRNQEIEQFLELQNPYIYLLPPLTAILLQRCKTLEDLPDELIKLREEFQHLRKALTEFQKRFEEASTIKEKIEVKKEFQESINLFVRKVRKPKKRIIKTIMDFTITQSQDLIKKDFSGPIRKIINALIEYIYYKKIYPWVSDFIYLYNKSLEIKLDWNIYEKIFGTIELDYLDEFKLFAKNTLKLLYSQPRMI